MTGDTDGFVLDVTVEDVTVDGEPVERLRAGQSVDGGMPRSRQRAVEDSPRSRRLSAADDVLISASLDEWQRDLGYDPASVYDGVATGTWIQWQFETQVGTPIDGSSPQLRNLSPFVVRIIPPEAFVGTNVENGGSDFDVNLIHTASYTGAIDSGSQWLQLSNDTQSPVAGEGYMSNDAALQQIVSAGREINAVGGNMEEVSVITDVYTYADIALQVQRLINTPPLQMLINPQELSITYTSIQEYQNRGREGYIFQRWGEEQPKLSIKGSTGSFITGAPPGTIGSDVDGQGLNEGELFERFNSTQGIPCATGVQWASRRDSAAWQNFMALYHFYRSGGIVYDTVRESCAHLGVGAIAIDYDQWTYVGTIESFNFSFQEGLPHRVEWSMEFTVSQMYDHASAPTFVLPMKPVQDMSISTALKRVNSSVVADAGKTSSAAGLDQGREEAELSKVSSAAGLDQGREEAGLPPKTSSAAGLDQGREEVVTSGGASLAARFQAEGSYPFALIGGE